MSESIEARRAAHESAHERILELFLAAVRARPELIEELRDSVPVYFGGAAPVADPAASLLAARRQAEWFVLERHSPALHGTPAERLLGEVREGLAGESEEALVGWLASSAGAYLVADVASGEGAWLRDLSGLAEYALFAPELARRLEEGDLLVGRLAPIGDGLHVASPAASVFRGAGLVEALERDLAKLRARPGAKILRFDQAELERMFFALAGEHAAFLERSEPSDVALPPRADGGEPPLAATAPGDGAADPVARARDWLLTNGLAAPRADDLLARLERSPLGAENLTPGRGDTLGQVLDDLAFSTEADLETARRLLLAAWRAGSPPEGVGERDARAPELSTESASAPAAVPERPPRSDAARARAVDEFAANRAAGADVAAELRALQAALGLDEDDEDEDDSPAPDFPGVVGAMVQEFVWEASLTDGEEAVASLAPLAHLAAFAAPIGVLEDLRGKDLVRFASFWIIERDVVRSAEAARALLAGLRRFAEWCRDVQEHDVMDALSPALGGLESSLPRVVEANRRLARGSAAELERAATYEVADEGATRWLDAAGRELSLCVDASFREWLAPGDRVRGRVEGGVLTALRVYPPEAALAV